MKTITVISLLFALVWGCTPKAAPTAPKTAEAPKAEVSPAPPPAAIPATPAPDPATGKINVALIESGKKVFETRCGKCHGLKKTDDYTTTDWTGIMVRMAPKARLDETEKTQVLAYVQHYAKDAPKNKEGM